MYTEKRILQEETSVGELMDIDENYWKFWYPDESAQKVQKITLSLYDSLIRTATELRTDEECLADVKLMPDDVEFVVLDMRNPDSSCIIDGYDRSNVLRYYARKGYTY